MSLLAVAKVHESDLSKQETTTPEPDSTVGSLAIQGLQNNSLLDSLLAVGEVLDNSPSSKHGKGSHRVSSRKTIAMLFGVYTCTCVHEALREM